MHSFLTLTLGCFQVQVEAVQQLAGGFVADCNIVAAWWVPLVHPAKPRGSGTKACTLPA
jgi:hypothetical protein